MTFVTQDIYKCDQVQLTKGKLSSIGKAEAGHSTGNQRPVCVCVDGLVVTFETNWSWNQWSVSCRHSVTSWSERASCMVSVAIQKVRAPSCGGNWELIAQSTFRSVSNSLRFEVQCVMQADTLLLVMPADMYFKWQHLPLTRKIYLLRTYWNSIYYNHLYIEIHKVTRDEFYSHFIWSHHTFKNNISRRFCSIQCSEFSWRQIISKAPAGDKAHLCLLTSSN